MKLNIATYLLSKPELAYQLGRSPDKSALEICGMFAATYGCPIIAALYFAGEIRGFTEEIYSAIEAHMKFYIVTDVEGVSVDFRRETEKRRERNRATDETEQATDETCGQTAGGEHTIG